MSLLLRHTPGEWDGTFTVLARELARDLLLDGDIAVAINNEVRLRMLTGYDPDRDCLIFTGSETIDLTDIDEIEVR